MRSVYGSSYVNIAASSGTNVHDSCFSKRANHNGGFLTRVTTSEFCRVQNFHSGQVYRHSTTETHLASRAWTFQERLLAPRTIYFGDRGLFWECRTTIASEYLPDGFPGLLGWQMVCPEGTPWIWMDIVEHYSRASLTYGADKLPALAGIAKRQHEATGDDYVAGMWKNGLMKQLGWMPQTKNRRPEWRAPTWSWTSIDAEIWYWGLWDHEDVAKDEYVQVLAASTTVADLDPFGAVSDGELQLRCIALICGRCYHHNDMTADSVIIGAEARDFPMREFPITMDCMDDDFHEADKPIYLLPLFGGESGRVQFFSGNQNSAGECEETIVHQLFIRGLILQRSGLTTGPFRRIGSFDYRHGPIQFEDAESRKDHYYGFLQIMEEVGASTAESECAEIRADHEHPESRYVITVI
jgi:hypothetical protein